MPAEHENLQACRSWKQILRRNNFETDYKKHNCGFRKSFSVIVRVNIVQGRGLRLIESVALKLFRALPGSYLLP